MGESRSKTSWLRLAARHGLMLTALFGVVHAATAQEEKGATTEASEPKSPQAETVRKHLTSYVDAYNAKDVDKLMEHWHDDGVHTDADGGKTVGKEALAARLKTLFKAQGDAKLDLMVTSVSAPVADVLISDGIAMVSVNGRPHMEGHFSAVWAKGTDGTWKLASVRELPGSGSDSETPNEVGALAWMVGNWSGEDGKMTARLWCHWSINGHFLIRRFSMYYDGQKVMEGLELIGWDAAEEEIHSWSFDSEGGVTQGVWKNRDDAWHVNAHASLASGDKASAIHVYKAIDDNSFEWSSISREVDGQLLPDIGPMTVVRDASGQ
ncbi:SnoaL-like domain protein [Planctomycetes bacterium Pan216]|uniref:SnoaL-like domain protein n=1 Tax=Kolteria novifilia TaxID=2527975 RepID=A0A518B4C0_9BACT|nr:SnoaL-like domain protein [Planctomycetes bacterium Pan216]